jgi:hypothetical protein
MTGRGRRFKGTDDDLSMIDMKNDKNDMSISLTLFMPIREQMSKRPPMLLTNLISSHAWQKEFAHFNLQMESH